MSEKKEVNIGQDIFNLACEINRGARTEAMFSDPTFRKYYNDWLDDLPPVEEQEQETGSFSVLPASEESENE